MNLKLGLDCLKICSLRHSLGYSLVYKLNYNAEFLKIIPIGGIYKDYSSISRVNDNKTVSHISIFSLMSFRKSVLQSSLNFGTGNVCFKSTYVKKKGQGKLTESKNPDPDADADTDDEDVKDWVLEKGKNFKDITVKIPSTRLDTIIKAGFGLSRSKIDENFYGGKFKVNKEKSPKKSINLGPGNYVDYFNSTTSGMGAVEISRVVILKVSEYDASSDRYTVLLRKYPRLSMKSYEEEEE